MEGARNNMTYISFLGN